MSSTIVLTRSKYIIVNDFAYRVDRTKTGYVLGNPENRIDFPVAERDLQPPSHSLLSVLLHASLLLGACSDAKVSLYILWLLLFGDTRLFLVVTSYAIV